MLAYGKRAALSLIGHESRKTNIQLVYLGKGISKRVQLWKLNATVILPCAEKTVQNRLVALWSTNRS